MEPFAALGVAVNIFQIVQLSHDMFTTVKEFKTTGTTTDIDLQWSMANSQLNYAHKLKLLFEALQQATPRVSEQRNEASTQLSKLSASCSSEIALITAIETKAQSLVDELRRIMPKKKSLGSKVSALSSLRAAAQHIWSKDEIAEMEKRLEGYRSELSLRLVAVINEKVTDQDEKITEVLSLNRSIASWIQPHAAIITRRNGMSETILRPSLWKDFTGQDARDPENAISFNDSSSDTHTLVSDSDRPSSKATFDFAFSSIETRILYALRFRNIDARQQGVADAFGSTFQWIFDDADERPEAGRFLEWLREGDGSFWISGKAGAGKSSLMKLVASHSRLRHTLLQWVQNSPGCQDLVVATFFIYRYAEELQNSQEGLLRALLYQVLSQRKELIPMAFPSLCHTLVASPGLASLTLTIDELRSGFKNLTEAIPDSLKMFLIIDGIDEYTGDYRDLIQLFKDAVANKSVKALISSRPIPSCESAYAAGPHLRLQDLTKPDIVQYVQENLEANQLMCEKEQSEPGITREIADSVCNKASGVFLWVTLVVKSLLAGLENYDRKKDLLHTIDELPPDLEKLYSFMMKSVSDKYQKDASLMLQLMTRSRQIQHKYPLTVLQLSFAEEAEHEDDIAETPQTSISTAEYMRRCKATEGRMRSRCCGLIEVQTIALRSPCCQTVVRENRVNYLHRSVVEFLEISEVWDIVKSASPIPQAHLDELLLSSTVQTMKAPDIDQRTRCLDSPSHRRHEPASARPVYSALYCMQYSRSQVDTESSKYVDHLNQFRDLAKPLLSATHPSLATLVDQNLPLEGFYLQGSSGCDEPFLLYAAANGLSDCVSWTMQNQRPRDDDLRILFLYLLTNINNEYSRDVMSQEERRAQIRGLTKSAVSMLRRDLNPNDAGLFWPDISTAAVSKDIERAVLRSPKRDNGLIPWIYWLLCCDTSSELFMGEKLRYYEILEAMIDAGADLRGTLGGEIKGRVPVMSLVTEALSGLDLKNAEENKIYQRVKGKVQTQYAGQSTQQPQPPKIERAGRKRDRLLSITKGFNRVRVKGDSS